MRRNNRFLVFEVLIMIICLDPSMLRAEPKFDIGEPELVSFDHWSVEAVSYLYEYGLCENPMKYVCLIDNKDDAILVDRMARLTVQAYLTAKLSTINNEAVPPGAWLCIEGLATRYADEIDDSRKFPKEIVLTSRSMIPQSLYVREYKKMYEVPKDNWVFVGIDLFFLEPIPHKYYMKETVGRTITELELAMMVYRTIDAEMKSSTASARPDSGKLIVCDSMLTDLERAFTDLGLDVNGLRDWLRSQPEYPGDLTGD